MKSIVIVGASGVVGSRALEHLLACDGVGHVVALGRRLLPVQHEKLVSKVVDLQSSTALRQAVPSDEAIAVCCLGTTMKQAGSKPAFRAVDHDAVVAFGEAARGAGAQRFLLVSATGANAQSRNFYLKTKGEAEEALARTGFSQLTVLRPSFIDDQGTRTDHRLAERIGLPISRALFSIVGRTRRYAPIRADVIAKALVRLAFDVTTERLRIIESDQLHALGR
jgi:uncharacterized protein YbjT (DUF2867 family)